jgi:uncharacterized integral membrane protein
MYDKHMATLIVTILFGLIIGYFATQNTDLISLKFLQYTVPNIPTYIVVVGSLLVGLFLSWIISLVNDISNGFAMRGKENKIKDYKKESADLTKKVHQLELENTRLKAETNTVTDEKSL